MSEYHKMQKVKNIMNTASFHSSLSPPSSFGFPKACKKKKSITKIQVNGNKGLGWVGDKGPGEKLVVSRTIGEAEP